MTDAGAEPTEIGPFRVLRKLGEGAMGVVYAGYDEALDRRVALKLVRRQLLRNEAVRRRMTREAQAMARLSNPHVVQVYQVGEHGDGVYVAMEYVDGMTLGTWLRQETRSWRTILRAVCDAGRGLAAAHAAGLIHRDFKPDNVLVDADGHARVLDFGLVHREGGPTDEELASTDADEPSTMATTPPNVNVERSELHWSVRLTQVGNVLGTPAYMSPEQHFGRPAGPTSDQFSFCITLYEALYGTRPFNGDSWASIRTQVQEGIVPPPPLESRVPRRLFRVIARGLATDPERRWSSMEALIDALEHDPWRARLRVAAVAGLIGVASAGSYAVAMSQLSGPQCEARPELLAGVWDAARETEVSRAFAATRASFSADTWNRVHERLDAYAQGWTGAWQSACEARAQGVQTGRLADLRSACLGQRRARLKALVDVFTRADRSVVENAVQAIAALPSVGACGQEESLELAAAPPDDPRVAAEVESLRGKFAEVQALEGTGQFEAGLKSAAEIRLAADGLGYAPLVAEAVLVEGRILMNLQRAADAEAALMRAVRIGVANDLHAVAAEAAVIWVFVVGQAGHRPREALAAVPFVEAQVERARDDGQLVALLLNNLGVVNYVAGEPEKAKEFLGRAIEALARRTEGGDPMVAIAYNNLGNLHYEQDDLDAARANFQRSAELFTTLLGESHPLVGHPLAGLGDVAVKRADANEAMTSYFRALALMEGAYGVEHPLLLAILPGLGRAHLLVGRLEEARQYFARAVELAETTTSQGVESAGALEGLGDVAAREGFREEARKLYARAAEAFDAAAGPDSDKGARAALRAGELARELGDSEGAVTWFERVVARKSAPRGRDAVRGGAALGLAAALAERAGATARVCALADEARAQLPAGDPRRDEAEGLVDRACPKG